MQQKISRRKFVSRSAILGAGVALPCFVPTGCMGAAQPAGPEKTAAAQECFIRPVAPLFEIPPYLGERYEDKTPATLDLAEMAAHSINGMTGPSDPDNHHELYFVVNWFHNPPLMYHEFSSGCQRKFLGPLVLNRIISGSDLNLDTERKIMEAFLKGIGPDGLYHEPIAGRPWHNHGWDRVTWANFGAAKTLDESAAKKLNAAEPPYAGGRINPRLIEGLLIYGLRDQNRLWRETVAKMIEEGTKGMVDKGDWGYFGPPDSVPTGFNADGWLAQALGQCCRVTGNERARVVGGKFTRYLRDHADYFGPNGRFIGDVKFFGPEKAKYGGHFHNHTNCLIGMLEYALATGDRALAEFTRKSYEWARSEKGCGSVVTGFFPEFVGPEYPNSEGCPVADMVALALMLSEGGVGDYWDDADRWLRNYFAEIQLTKAQGENLERLAAAQKKGDIPYNATAGRVTARNLGAFAGWPGGNEWAHHIGIQHCCTGNGSRTIYYAWEKILKYQDGALRVNLLLNRASTWADVYSRIPYEGQVDLKIKQPCQRVLIRMPEYVEAKNGSVQCSVNGKARAITWEGRRLGLEAAQTGDRISVKFPIRERTVKDRMGGVDYTLTVKGNTVVAIDPPGKNAPLFQRAHLRENKTLWRTVNRFVSNEQIDW